MPSKAAPLGMRTGLGGPPDGASTGGGAGCWAAGRGFWTGCAAGAGLATRGAGTGAGAGALFGAAILLMVGAGFAARYRSVVGTPPVKAQPAPAKILPVQRTAKPAPTIRRIAAPNSAPAPAPVPAPRAVSYTHLRA